MTAAQLGQITSCRKFLKCFNKQNMSTGLEMVVQIQRTGHQRENKTLPLSFANRCLHIFLYTHNCMKIKKCKGINSFIFKNT